MILFVSAYIAVMLGKAVALCVIAFFCGLLGIIRK